MNQQFILNKQLIYIIHIFFVGPLFIYIYSIGNKLSIKSNDLQYRQTFQMIRLIGIMIILYHGYQLLQYHK